MREAAAAPERSAEPLAVATLAACSVVSVPLAELDALRASPGPGAKPAVVKTLRNADEQTVAGVAAMLRAIDSRGWQAESFRDWGVIGCPTFLARTNISGVIARFFTDPKYSISPHVIPNFSLHAPSGTVSVGFTMQGPNFGVGGGPGSIAEGLLTALSVISERRLPGVWLMLSGFNPEPRPDNAGKAMNAVDVHAAALAITPSGDGIGRIRLFRRDAGTAASTMPEVVRSLAAGNTTIRCPVDGLGVIELDVESPR